jgi:hypothetical protein
MEGKILHDPPSCAHLTTFKTGGKAMEEENRPQEDAENRPQEDAEEVEAHHRARTGPEDPGRRALNEEEDDEVEAHRFRTTGPEEPGRRA